ncbi:hypothetical protein HZH68_012846 [Vespula germanica]|uniref:Uncharacterized protein n=1 Tax=Vespula germanica TaxID=30212 RepID=A0A834MXD2_VESGE|nr:hypothetical protein HZH68_012846 [Vespula germanica]
MFALCFSLEFTPNLLLPTTPVNEALDLVKLWKKEVAEWKASGQAHDEKMGCKTIPQEYIYENGVQSKRVSSSQVHSSK